MDVLLPGQTMMKCNKIISLLHGTKLDNLMNILSTNTIKSGDGSNTNVHTTPRVSAYPILNCDINNYSY